MSTQTAAGPTRVLLLALDAGDARLIRGWAQSGDLPACQRLFQEGLCLEVEDQPALWASAAWPSLVTGADPATHGSWFYNRYDPSTYASSPDREAGFGVATFWERLAAAGRRVAVLDVPGVPLAREIGHGIQLLDWGVHDAAGPTRSLPAGLAAEVLARFGPEPVGQCDYLGRGPRRFDEFRDRLVERARTRHDLIAHYLDQGGWDLVFAAFTELHCVGHQAWHLHDPEHPAHDATLADEIGDPVLDVYREVDRAIGRLFERAGPDTRCLLVATHGMGPSFRSHFSLDRVLDRIEGTRTPSAHALSRLLRIWLRLPAGLRAVLRPVGRRIRGRLAPAGRRHRRCFEQATHCGYAGLRVNLEGREANGLVAAADFETYCQSLSATLGRLADPRTGRSLVRRIWITSEHYPCRADHRLPDLVLEWERDLAAEAAESPELGRIECTVPPHAANRTGDHRPHGGLLAAIGGGISPGRPTRRIRIEQIAPTLLDWLGVSPAELDGGLIPELAIPATADRPPAPAPERGRE